MPYFAELHGLLAQVMDWADLRHEQGINVKPVMDRLRSDLERTMRALERAEPKGKQLEQEPNALKAIKALRPDGPRRLTTALDASSLRARLCGAWLGRAAGCTLGAPVEGWSPADMERLAKRSGAAFPPTDYWPDHPYPDHERYATSVMRDYLRGHISAAPVDDDLTYTLLGLLILEEYGPDFATEDVAEAWLKYLPTACTAEHVALENLKAGIPARRAAIRNNPYMQWIGADIRSDPWGYAAPGWPERAAEMAYRDACLTHRQNGVYGAMLFSAAIAAALVGDCPLRSVEIGLTEIPKTSRLAHEVTWALETGPKLKDWRTARAAVDDRFPGMHPVHTINNACLTVFGLVLGKMDFTRTIGITVAMGLDNDCTAATAGSILGAVIGADNIPSHWWKPFRNRTRTYLRGHEWFRNTDIIGRFLAIAARTVA